MFDVNLKLTAQEAQDLANLLDVAVKAVGLQAAQPALSIFLKLKEAAQNQQAN